MKFHSEGDGSIFSLQGRGKGMTLDACNNGGRRKFSSALAGSTHVLLLELGSMATIEVEVGSRCRLWTDENRCDEAVTKPCDFVPGNFSQGKSHCRQPTSMVASQHQPAKSL